MPSSYNLSELVKKEIDALVKSGYYSSKSDVMKDALRYMLESKMSLRLAASIDFYKRGEASPGKAAEINGLGVVEFKGRRKDFGITRAIEVECEKDGWSWPRLRGSTDEGCRRYRHSQHLCKNWQTCSVI